MMGHSKAIDMRKWVGYYGGVMAYRRDNSADGDLFPTFARL
jgi:hypothetical protein